MLERLRSPPLAAAVLSLVVALSVILLRWLGTLQQLELITYDQYVTLRADPGAIDHRVVLVGITEDDIRDLGRWPLTDADLADLLNRVARHGPRAIGVDIYRDIPVPPGAKELATAFKTHRQVVAVTKLGDLEGSGIRAPAVLEGTEQVGFNDVVVDPGGVVRRGLLFLDDGGTTMYALGLRLALLYLAAEGIVTEPDPIDATHLRLGRTTIRPLEDNDGGYVGIDARGYQFLLDFQPGRLPFRSFSARDVLSGAIEADMFRDKVVVIGTTAKSVADIFYVPQNLFEAEAGIPGMVLHAHVAGQLLRAALDGVPPITSPSDLAEGTWVLLWGIAGGILGLWARSPGRFACCTLTGPVLLAGLGHFAFARRCWVPVVPAALAWGVSAAVVTAYLSNQERVQRKLLMQLFARHVSPDVAETVWRQREQFLKGGRPRPQRLTATVLFSDLRGFTAVSEKLAPEILVEWLNEYIESMAEQVIAHGGLIDKYIGDAVMAVFGLPLPSTSHLEVRQDAVAAVRCAVAMEAKIAQLNEGWRRKALPTISVRIGIATGPLVAGSLGSAERLEYTVIGDTVNTAARLASYEPDAAVRSEPPPMCNILATEETACYVGAAFDLVRLGTAALKGKARVVTIYRVVGSLPSATGSKAEGEL